MSEQLHLTGTLLLRWTPATAQVIQNELRSLIARYNPSAKEQALQQLLQSTTLGQTFLRDIFRLESHERMVRGQMVRLDFRENPHENNVSVLFIVDDANWNKHLNGNGRVFAFVANLTQVGQQISCMEVQRVLVLHTESSSKIVSRLTNTVACNFTFLEEQADLQKKLELTNDRISWEQLKQLELLDINYFEQFSSDMRHLLGTSLSQAHGLRYLYAQYVSERQRLQMLVFSPNQAKWQQALEHLRTGTIDLYELPDKSSLEIDMGQLQPQHFYTANCPDVAFIPRSNARSNSKNNGRIPQIHLTNLNLVQEPLKTVSKVSEELETNLDWNNDPLTYFSSTLETNTVSSPSWQVEIPFEQWTAEVQEVYSQLNQEWQEMYQWWSDPSTKPQEIAYFAQQFAQKSTARISLSEALRLEQYLSAPREEEHNPKVQAYLQENLNLLRSSERNPFHVIELDISVELARQLYEANFTGEQTGQLTSAEEATQAQELILIQLSRMLPSSGLLLPKYFRRFASLAQQYTNLSLFTQTRNFAIPYAPNYLSNATQITRAVGSVGAYTPQLITQAQTNSDYESLINFASQNSELGIVNFAPHTNQNLYTAEMLSYLAASGKTVLYVARNAEQLELFNQYLQHAPQVLSVRLDTPDALPMRCYYRALEQGYNESYIQPRVRRQELQHEYRERVVSFDQDILNLNNSFAAYSAHVERQDTIENDVIEAQGQLVVAEQEQRRAQINLDNLERLLRMLRFERIRPEQWTQNLEFTKLAHLVVNEILNEKSLGLISKQLTDQGIKRLQDYLNNQLPHNSQESVNILYDILRMYCEEFIPSWENLQQQVSEKSDLNYQQLSQDINQAQNQRQELLDKRELLSQTQDKRDALNQQLELESANFESYKERRNELEQQIQITEAQATQSNSQDEAHDSETSLDCCNSALENETNSDSDFLGLSNFAESFKEQAKESAQFNVDVDAKLFGLRQELSDIQAKLDNYSELQQQVKELEQEIKTLSLEITRLKAVASPQTEAKLKQQLRFVRTQFGFINRDYDEIDARELEQDRIFVEKRQRLNRAVARIGEVRALFQQHLTDLERTWLSTESTQRQQYEEAQIRQQQCLNELAQLQQEQRVLGTQITQSRADLERTFNNCRQALSTLPNEVLLREREDYPEASYFAADVMNLGNTVVSSQPLSEEARPELSLEEYRQQFEVFSERLENLSLVIHSLNDENHEEFEYLNANTTFTVFDQRWQEVLDFCSNRSQENSEIVAEYKYRCNIVLTTVDTAPHALQRNQLWDKFDVVVISQAHEVEPLLLMPYLARGQRVLLLGDVHQASQHHLPLSVRQELAQQIKRKIDAQADHALAQRELQVVAASDVIQRLERNWMTTLLEQAQGYNYLSLELGNQSSVARGITNVLSLTYGREIFNTARREWNHQWVMYARPQDLTQLIWSGHHHFVWVDTHSLHNHSSIAGVNTREARLVVQALQHLDSCLAQHGEPIDPSDFQQRYEMHSQAQRNVGVVVYSHSQALEIYQQMRELNFFPRNLHLDIIPVEQLQDQTYHYVLVSITTEQISDLQGTECLADVSLFNRVLGRARGMVLWLGDGEILAPINFTLTQVDEETNKATRVEVSVYQQLIQGCRTQDLGAYVNGADLENYLRNHLGK